MDKKYPPIDNLYSIASWLNDLQTKGKWKHSINQGLAPSSAFLQIFDFLTLPAYRKKGFPYDVGLHLITRRFP